MTTHSEAMRTAVHGKVQPMSRPNIFARIRALHTERNRLAAEAGEPKPVGALVGISLTLAATFVWAAVYFFGG